MNVGKLHYGVALLLALMAAKMLGCFVDAPQGNWSSTEKIDQVVSQYCNAPGRMMNGTEGLSDGSDQQLCSVVVLVRHGDRTAVSRPGKYQGDFHNSSAPSQFKEMLAEYKKALATLTDEDKRSWHPDLRGIDVYPTPGRDFTLTDVGIVQAIEVGQYLRKRYLSDCRDCTLDCQDIIASSSQNGRTLQSMLALIHGMAPLRFREIASRARSTDDVYICDNSETATVSCSCGEVEKIRQLRASFRDWNLKDRTMRFLYDFLDVGGGEGVSLGDGATYRTATPSRTWDWLVSRYLCRGERLPCIDQTCLNTSVLSRLQAVVEGNHRRMVRDPRYLRATSLAMFPFLQTLRQIFTEKRGSSCGKSPDVRVYSTHDVTIGPLFNALGAPIASKAPYASRLAFELWRQRATYVIKVIFNGNDITSRLAFCSDDSSARWRQGSDFAEESNSAFCPLEKFVDFLEDGFFGDMSGKDYESACGP